MKKRFLFILISIVLFLGGCSNNVNLNENEIDTETSDKAIEDKAIEDTKNIYLDLSEQDIEEAIKEGKKGVKSILEYIPKHYSLKYISGEKRLMGNAEIMTPYSAIVTVSALKSSKYQEVSQNYIDGLLKEHEYMVVFNVEMYGESMDFPSSVHIVMKQDDKVIQPMEIYGIDDMAEMSANWPNFPAYEARFTPVFSINEIDFDKDAELIIIFAGEMEIKYEVDFGKYK